MKKEILILGAGGHAKACIDVIESTGHFLIKGIVVNDRGTEERILGYPILGNDDQLPELLKECPNVFVGVGQIKSPSVRKRLVEKCRELGAKFPTIIASSAIVSPHSKIGEGSIVMHASVIHVEANVGNFCILNDRSLIEHGCIVGSFSHISTGAIINGDVSVGEDCFIGSGSVVFHECKIEDNVIVSAGTIVRRNISRGEKVF